MWNHFMYQKGIRSVHGVPQRRRPSTNYFSFSLSDMPFCLKYLNTNEFLDPYNLIQLADDTLTPAEYYETLRQKFIAMILYSKRKYQVQNVNFGILEFISTIEEKIRSDDSSMIFIIGISYIQRNHAFIICL